MNPHPFFFEEYLLHEKLRRGVEVEAISWSGMSYPSMSVSLLPMVAKLPAKAVIALVIVTFVAIEHYKNTVRMAFA